MMIRHRLHTARRSNVRGTRFRQAFPIGDHTFHTVTPGRKMRGGYRPDTKGFLPGEGDPGRKGRWPGRATGPSAVR